MTVDSRRNACGERPGAPAHGPAVLDRLAKSAERPGRSVHRIDVVQHFRGDAAALIEPRRAPGHFEAGSQGLSFGSRRE